MSEDYRADHPLDRELSDLGPLMKAQEQANVEGPDPEFVSSLRSRLVGDKPLMSMPRQRIPVPVLEPISLARRRRQRLKFGVGLIAAAAAAALITLAITSRNAESPGGGKSVASGVPIPNATELTRTFPVYGLGGGGGLPNPWDTQLDFTHIGGPVYPRHLTLSAGSLSTTGPSEVAAERLVGPAFDAGRIAQLARTLGIRGPVRRSRQPNGTWAYAEDVTGGRHPTIHSVAVNLATGALIYHDSRQSFTSRIPAPHNSLRNVGLARRWLSQLGWPGARMPVHTSTATQERRLTWGVTLGWASGFRTDAPDATLLLSPGRPGRRSLRSAAGRPGLPSARTGIPEGLERGGYR
jgi:hypothetical protein